MSDTMCAKTTETSRCQRCGSEFDWLSDGTKIHAGKRYFESDSLLCLERQLNAANERIKRLEEAEQWIPVSTKPEGCERKVLLWIVWPQMRGWCDSPEPLIGWWKHGPQCFALGDIENADHLVRYWMEIPDPTEAKEAKL